MVERIGRFEPQLEAHLLLHQDVLHQRQVRYIQTGPVEGIPADIAERPKWRVANDSRPKVEIAGMRCACAISQRLLLPGIVFHNGTDLVGIVPAGVKDDSKSWTSQRRLTGIVKAKGEPSLERGVARNSPAFEDPGHNTARRESVRHWDLILIAGHEALVGVEV